MIEALLDANGTATLRRLALALVAADEAAMSTAEAKLRKMPLEVLRKRQVVTWSAPGLWALTRGNPSMAVLPATCRSPGPPASRPRRRTLDTQAPG